MANRTTSKPRVKVAKPYADYPLTPHPSGRWCKKIRGKLHYFGKIDDPAAALTSFNREWPYLQDGRTPPPFDTGDGCTVRLLCNAFLTAKKAHLDSGELSARSFQDYFRACETLVNHLGKDRRVDDLRSDDFRDLRAVLQTTRSPVSLKNEIIRSRMVFKFAVDERLIEKPVHYGQAFAVPTAKTLRKVRKRSGRKLFTRDEAIRILGAADVQLKAMILLGLNCGFGNTDCATVPITAFDLDGRWVDFPRPKTGIDRRIPLWPKTVKALRDALASRNKPVSQEDSDLAFLTRNGTRWVRVQQNRKATGFTNIDALAHAFSKLLRSLDINGHRNFYALRHCFETYGGEAKDQVAVDAIMGHVDPSMADRYREEISDERLRAVTEHVRTWLFGASKSVPGNTSAPTRAIAATGRRPADDR
ncbi:MAG TPA: tyrosine-type recombinase/integrase [Planctomycetaceae bacterium]|nr:tyrosine-type recombinase/integrase [Planctomycetaceae bacterium]